MAPPTNHGPINWGMQRSEEGHRTYNITFLVETLNENAGPLTAFNTPGLPLTGAGWNYGEDVDLWATCYPTAKVRVSSRQKKEEKGRFWEVSNIFSTKPRNRCQDTDIEDPLLEPPAVSGSFTKSTKEAFYDRNGDKIQSTSQEWLPLTVSDNHPTVVIGQNVATLGLDVFSEMVDTVNDATLWGLSSRKIKLANVSWSREYYGVCSVYYTRNFEFEVNFLTFDEELPDQGTTHVKDGGNPLLLGHYVQNVDPVDNTLGGLRGLKADGTLAQTPADVNSITPEYYPESNFLSLGIPTEL